MNYEEIEGICMKSRKLGVKRLKQVNFVNIEGCINSKIALFVVDDLKKRRNKKCFVKRVVQKFPLKMCIDKFSLKHALLGFIIVLYLSIYIVLLSA